MEGFFSFGISNVCPPTANNQQSNVWLTQGENSVNSTSGGKLNYTFMMSLATVVCFVLDLVSCYPISEQLYTILGNNPLCLLRYLKLINST